MTAINLSIEMCVGRFWNFCISDLNPGPFSGFFSHYTCAGCTTFNADIWEYYTITDFCRSEYEFLLTCKIILNEAEG